MLEGTNISEGRGTNRPFEILGAPFIDPHILANELSGGELPGAIFRPLHFQPTFHKHAGELCGGLQIHVTDRVAFKPVITALAVISAIRRLYPSEFEWKQPPYEYVYDRLPFDVINGTVRLREQIEAGMSWRRIEEDWRETISEFHRLRTPYLLY